MSRSASRSGGEYANFYEPTSPVWLCPPGSESSVTSSTEWLSRKCREGTPIRVLIPPCALSDSPLAELAGVNCNRSIAAQSRSPLRKSNPIISNSPARQVTQPSVDESHPNRLPPDAVQVNACESFIAVANLAIDGVPGSDRHGDEGKTSKGLDHKDQLWHTCHARWCSFTSAGFPTPTSLDGPHRALIRWITTSAAAAPGIRVTAWHRPDAHPAQAGLPSHSSCGLRGPAGTRKRALGAPVSAGGASGWRRCRV